MTLGSLFDGSGGFPLAGLMHGITPLWSSEIEEFPLRVTAKRFPDVKQLGDVCKINGSEIEPVDIITFGSPCQDLSVAGKQLGIHKGERSNLFFEAVRIIKEMRKATNDRYPRYAVWENVPGAFSSNGGEDFKAVLEALASVRQDGLSLPRPKRWNGPGCLVGNGWSIAWRLYDAQYWGVPQRRKRIYLIADFRTERAGEILFECESVSGNTESCGAKGQGFTADAEGSAGRSCLFEPRSLMEENWATQDTKNALRANASKSAHCVVEPAAFMGGQGAKARSIAYHDDGTTPTIKSVPSGGNTIPDVCYPINTMVATRHNRDDGRTTFGVGEDGDPQFTLQAAHEHAVCYAIEGNTIDRNSHQNGCGYREEISPTLNTQDRHAICYGVDCRNGCLNEEKTITIQAKPNGGISLNCTPSVLYNADVYPVENHPADSRCELKEAGTPCQTLTSRMGTGGGNVPLILYNAQEKVKHD